MSKEILLRALNKIGLNDKEISLYLSVLELKESPIVPISSRANLPRTSAQYILEQLAHRGLIAIGEHRNRKTYRANPPERVLALLQKQKVDLAAQSTALQEALPDLLHLYQTSPFQPRVQVYRGEEIRIPFEELLEAPISEYHYASDTGTLEEVLGKRYLNDWIKRRIAKGVWSNGIRVKERETDDILHTSNSKNLRRLRFAPKGYRFPAMVLLYGDNVATITSAKENFAVVVTSHDYALTMRGWFAALWSQSTPSKK